MPALEDHLAAALPLIDMLADQALMKSAVEEIVRWTSPPVYKRRTATRDVELGGQRIRLGQKVTILQIQPERLHSAISPSSP